MVFHRQPKCGSASCRASPLASGLLRRAQDDAILGSEFWYNHPYSDIYMEIEEGYRRRGLGAYFVQELKRIAYEMGGIPAARCDPDNVASRKTLQKAGFVPFAHILVGTVAIA